MHFQLPSNLQQELLAYDPKLKALVKDNQPKKATKKAKYPLGNIPHLIPEDVVRSSYQQEAIDHINAQLAPGRIRLFTKLVDVATSQARTVPIAVLYHFEQCWYAAWLPQKGEDYIYGYAYAFKNTAAAAKQVPSHLWNHKDQCTEHTMGRGAQVFTYSATVTKQDIINGKDSRNWRAMGIASYYQKARDMNETINRFESQLMTTIPQWTDSRGIFDRLRCNNLIDALDMPAFFSKPIPDKTKYELTVDNLIATSKLLKNDYGYSSYGTCLTKTESIITTPYIKKQLQAMLDRSTTEYNSPENTQRKSIKYGFKEFEQTCNSIEFIIRIWPDCPIDHYRTYFNELRCINLNQFRYDERLIQWLKENMPIASFFNMLRKFNETETSALRSSWSDYDYHVKSFFEMNDTFSMIMRILENGKELEAPKR